MGSTPQSRIHPQLPSPRLYKVNNSSWQIRAHNRYTKRGMVIYSSTKLEEVEKRIKEINKLPLTELIIYKEKYRKYRRVPKPEQLVYIRELPLTKLGKPRFVIIKGKRYYGTFHNLGDAIAERDLLVKCGWNEELLWESEVE